ncbi:four helix bundle protein [Flavihumibacter sp. R14]|nr:four helix bundle protein [Flavihumibacter soli]
MNNLKELKIWRKAIDLAVKVYEVTANFPTDERYGLTSQTRRAAVSISSNIAEGAGRNSVREFNSFIGIANGSAYELQTQLLIANKLNLITNEVLDPLLLQIEEMQKMTYAFQKMLKTRVES